MFHCVRIPLLASALVFALGLASAAQAQIDIESIAFQRQIDLVDGGDDDESASFRVVVVASGVTSARLKLPEGGHEDLGEGPTGVWSASFAFNHADDLDDDFPADSDTYLVDLNDGEREIEIDYEAPALPDFAISSPVDGSDNNSPTTTPFTFSACPPADCSDGGDHVRAIVTKNEVEVSGIVDDPSTGSWSPTDEDGVPAVLPEGSKLTFFAELRANRPSYRVDDLDDFYTFWNVFNRSDEVDFDTGFRGIDDAPVGSFSIDGGDPGAFVLTGGPVMTELGGVVLDFDYELTPQGKLSGAGTADVNDDEVPDTEVEVKGKLKDKKGVLAQNLKIKIKSKEPGAEASAKYARDEFLDAGAEISERSETLKGKVLGDKVEDTAMDVDSIAGEVHGWVLGFDLSTEDGLKMQVTNAVLTVGDREVALEGGGRYDADEGRTQLQLKSSGDDKGAKVKVSDLVVDEEGGITGGVVEIKAFGQTAELEIF